MYRKPRPSSRSIVVEEEEEEAVPAASEAMNDDEDLTQRISLLMEQEQVYLDSNLKLSDLTRLLVRNRTAISACINSKWNCSFSQLVNNYRVTHAQRLMNKQADIKIAEVWMNSGFTTESSFFRAFKNVTGMTPMEWRKQKTTCK